MTKEQFSKLKVGDTVEYNYEGLLEGYQFKIEKINKNIVEGVVTRKGAGGSVINSYQVGQSIAKRAEQLTIVNSQEAKVEPFATLELSVQEAAVLFRLLRSVWGSEETSVRKFTGSISAKLSHKFTKMDCLDDLTMFGFNGYIEANISPEQLDSELVQIGLLKAPEKPKAAARHKLKGPDGKWAPKNYRVVTYPEHGKGEPVKRHVLWGDFVKGTSGTNVYVEEWCADSKKWCPKTYSLAKVGVAENN